MVYTSNGILFSLKKWNSDTCYNMDETWKHYISWNKPVTNITWFCLYEVPKIDKFIETESRIKVNIDWEWEGMGSYSLDGYRISVWADENILEIGNGDSCTTLWL